MKHLTDEELGAYMDGALKGRDAEAAGRHIAGCQPCREALAELAIQDESLKPALSHDPGEAYFERFATRVEGRIAAGAASRAHPRGAFDLGRFFRSPRALAWAGGVAVVVVGGGLALMTGRDSVLPGLRDRDLAARLERAAPAEEKRAQSSEARQVPLPVPPPSAEDAEGTAPSAAGEPAQEGSGVATPVPATGNGVGALDARRAPPASMAKEQVESPVERSVPRARPARDAKTRGDEFAPVPSPAPPATSAPAGPRPASPSRMMEVRRNEAGEEVPVRPPTVSRFAPPPSPSTASGADRTGLVVKKRFAEPLDALKQSAPTESVGAKDVRDKAREYSFAQPPTRTATPLTAGQAAPARIAEGETRVCGEVRDAAGRPIVGAQVVLTDLGRAAATDATGRFCMSAPSGEHPLSVMAVGYVESRQRVRTEDAEAGVRVTLAAVSVLEEKGMFRGGRAAPARVPVASTSEPRSQPPEPRDRYSVLSDTVRRVVREAQRIEADASALRSAAHFDMAARAWERALRRLAEGPLEIETRRHLAEARYRAWEIGPNSRRALVAVEALTAYVGRAPAGPERDEAARWLQRVRP